MTIKVLHKACMNMESYNVVEHVWKAAVVQVDQTLRKGGMTKI